MSSPDPRLDAALRLGLDDAPDPATARLAASLAEAFGPALACLVHYGSRSHGTAPAPESAHDFFVLVDAYGPAYRALVRRGELRPPAWLAAALNHVLPPNVIPARGPAGGPAAGAKCAVLSLSDLAVACSSRPRDHFVRARLFQPVEIVWARDPAAREAAAAAIAAARAGTFQWARSFLPPAFDARSYCGTLLRLSYAAEIRPESDEHLDRLLDAQSDTLLPLYGNLLEHLAARGRLVRDGEFFRQPQPPTALARLAARLFFRQSKLRATLRWIKYVALYEGWLDYVLKKIERRSGEALVLTSRERRWPLLFLWPKALRYLGRRPQRRS